MTLSIKGLYVTLTINDTQHNWQLVTMHSVMLRVIMLNVTFFYCYAECRYGECHCVQCRDAIWIAHLKRQDKQSLSQHASGRHDIQLNDTQHNDIQHNNKKRNTQRNNTSNCYADCRYAEYRLCCVSRISPLCRVSFCWMWWRLHLGLRYKAFSPNKLSCFVPVKYDYVE